VAKRTSACAPLLAALVAAQSYGGAVADLPLDDAVAHDTGDGLKAYGPAEDRGDTRSNPDSMFMTVESHDAARDGEQAEKSDRLPTSPSGGVADEIVVRTSSANGGKTILVMVALVLPINQEVVRAVLSDYENMPRFVPDIHTTRVSNAGPGGKRVEIEGTANFFVMEFPVTTTLDVVYPPDGSIAINSVAGNLAINGVVKLHSDGPSTRVDYQARITPDFWLPPLIGDLLIGRLIKRQFEGMVAEMYRRAGKIGNTSK